MCCFYFSSLISGDRTAKPSVQSSVGGRHRLSLLSLKGPKFLAGFCPFQIASAACAAITHRCPPASHPHAPPITPAYSIHRLSHLIQSNICQRATCRLAVRFVGHLLPQKRAARVQYPLRTGNDISRKPDQPLKATFCKCTAAGPRGLRLPIDAGFGVRTPLHRRACALTGSSHDP
jgi:hypothetical protein